MYHPQGFNDSSNIIIKCDKAFYYYIGNSYLEKFKNGLSLEDKFNFDLNVEYNQVINNEFTVKNNDNKIQEQNLNKINYDDEICCYKFPKERKGKLNKSKKGQWNKEEENQINKEENQINKEDNHKEVKKKIYGKKMKKNKIRQNGFDDKMFCVSQNVIKLDNLLSDYELNDIYYEEKYEFPCKANNYYGDDITLYNYDDFENYNEFDYYDKREESRYRLCGY